MPQQSTESPKPGSLKKWSIRGVLTILVLAAGVSSYFYINLKNSLPILQGHIELAGLQSTVTIERDELGVPAITAGNRLDIAYAMGFLHAQERFFQMDLMRRQGSGELAELFGEKAVALDKASRIHRFRHRAKGFITTLDESKRAFLSTYTQGVNAGLAQLSAPPFEYQLLRQAPAAWRMEDTYLCVYAMYMLLQNSNGQRESNLALMHDLLPSSLVEFLVPTGTRWDAAIDNTNYKQPPLPTQQNYFSSATEKYPASASTPEQTGSFPLDIPDELRSALGSNNWAVSGKLTEHGGAIVANDMHLPISIPNTWYRASFILKTDAGNKRLITGVTLPGGPSMITGSTPNIAWAYTNSYGDWGDLILLELDSGSENRYRTPDGFQPFQKTSETIKVKDAEDVEFNIDETIWGPVIDTDHRGRKRVYRWVAHFEEAVNLNLLELESATNAREAMAIAHRCGIPAQNFVVGDKDGNIGWTITGPIPKRVGFDGRLPQSWADGNKYWDGWLAPAEYPAVFNPESGRIWSANTRVVGGKMFDSLYDGYYAFGARAQQIRDDLFAKDSFKETDMLEIQRDNRAVFLTRWQQMLLNLLTDSTLAGKPNRAEFRRLLETWEGRASVTSAGYRLVKAYRKSLSEDIFDGLLAKLNGADPSFRYIFNTTHQWEQPLWDLVTQQPKYLLLPEYSSWQELLLAHVDKVIADLEAPLADRTWGEQNTVAVQHPFSKAMPLLGKWLDIPAQALNGDWDMPFVQSPWKGKSLGASERLAVSPGREELAYFHMPTGQSGHPLSPFYNKGHEAWVNGVATPFLPQEAKYVLELRPVK